MDEWLFCRRGHCCDGAKSPWKSKNKTHLPAHVQLRHEAPLTYDSSIAYHVPRYNTGHLNVKAYISYHMGNKSTVAGGTTGGMIRTCKHSGRCVHLSSFNKHRAVIISDLVAGRPCAPRARTRSRPGPSSGGWLESYNCHPVTIRGSNKRSRYIQADKLNHRQASWVRFDVGTTIQ